jgi:hypothetical protein
MPSVVREATYAPSSCGLDLLQIGVHLTHFERSEYTVIRWREISTACWVEEKLKIQFSYSFNGRCCRMRLSVFIMQNSSICQHSSAFTANSGFYLLFKISTKPCTTEPLSAILVELEVGPIKSQNSVESTLWQKELFVYNFLVLGNDMCFHSMLWPLLAGS